MNFKYNTKQRTKSVQGLRSFKDTLPQEAKRILNKKGQIYSNTLDNWKFLVGKELFNVCYPISFKNSKLNGSCLNIMVKRGHEVDVEYSKKIIFSVVRPSFGCCIIWEFGRSSSVQNTPTRCANNFHTRQASF